MDFKTWIMREMFVPGSYYNSPKDITNIGLGVRSKYISPEESGVTKHPVQVKTAQFGFSPDDNLKMRKLKKLYRFTKQLGK